MSNYQDNNIENSHIKETNVRTSTSSGEQSKVNSAHAETEFLQQQLLLAGLQKNQLASNEVSLGKLLKVIWKGKLTVIGFSFVFAVASILFALSKPNIYKASALLAPASVEGGAGGLSALAGQFGGLASMAGINLGGGGTDKTTLALQIIRSRQFLENFIKNHNLLVPLMATEKWDLATNTLIYDDEVYDKSNKNWIREAKPPKQAQPSSWEAYKEFLELLYVSQDEKTGMVSIQIEFFSPELATQWLTWLIADVNEYMRIQDQQEAQDSIDYLTKQLKKIHVASMETVFYQLIEEQTKSMMLTQVKSEYVLKTIDPAQAPEEKAKPQRALIVVLGTVFGGFLAVIIVLIRYFLNKENENTK